ARGLRLFVAPEKVFQQGVYPTRRFIFPLECATSVLPGLHLRRPKPGGLVPFPLPFASPSLR
ncbi:hypothetical protein BGZ92_007272, partial [Podila epicladia]